MNRLLLSIALLATLAMSTPAMAQEDCPRGTLDKAYCDRDGDLTADCPGRSEEAHQSVDADLCLHADRRPGGVPEGVGRFPQAPGKAHRQARGFLPGTIERRAIRGHAIRAAACRRLERRRQRHWR